jgi:hypothetical protein
MVAHCRAPTIRVDHFARRSHGTLSYRGGAHLQATNALARTLTGQSADDRAQTIWRCAMAHSSFSIHSPCPPWPSARSVSDFFGNSAPAHVSSLISDVGQLQNPALSLVSPSSHPYCIPHRRRNANAAWNLPSPLLIIPLPVETSEFYE